MGGSAYRGRAYRPNPRRRHEESTHPRVASACTSKVCRTCRIHKHWNRRQNIFELKPALLKLSLVMRLVRETLESITSILSQRMTGWARDLSLEHSKFPLRMDLKNLTIVCGYNARPCSHGPHGKWRELGRLYLIAHLALHQWFVDGGAAGTQLSLSRSTLAGLFSR